MPEYNIDMSGAEKAIEAVPTAVYQLQIVEIEEKEAGENAKTPGAPYFNVQCEITEGDYMGRMVWGMVQIPSPMRDKKGQDAAIRSLGNFLKCMTGSAETNKFSTDDFLGVEFKGFVKKEDGKDGNDDRSGIKKFLS